METEKKGVQRNTQAQENPIQMHPYSKKPGRGHKEAVALLNWYIRNMNDCDWVSSAPYKVGV